MAFNQRSWRRDPAILARMHEVERRHLAGQPNTTIAAALGVDEGTIRNDLKRLSEHWLERIGETQETLRAAVTAELEDVRRRSIQAAEFDEMAERAVLFDGPDEEGRQVERPEKGSVSFKGGKAAALSNARQASMDKAKLLGLIVEKQEHTTPLPVRIYEYEAAPDGDGNPPA